MAEDRNNSQGLIGQAHTTERGSPPPPAPAAPTTVSTGVGTGPRSVRRDDSPPRGPRTLLLRRGENGFGFTLRHFIVYPPESCCMLPDNERTRIDEPMDTIFVKQVRANSPAAEAGLRTGDRLVSVDGKATRDEQYAKVVQRIQQAGPWLRLLVVSKEDDILQRYFGETAHNPETNQRPRLRSPERSSHKQRRSISMIPGSSPRARQSWVCSPTNSMPLESDQPIDDCLSTREQVFCRPEFSKETRMNEDRTSRSQSQLQTQSKGVTYRKPLQEIAARYESVHQKLPLRNSFQSTDSSPDMQSCDKSMLSDTLKSDKYDCCDRTRCESLYSRANSDQIYDRIKDPIYERVRVGEPVRSNTEEHRSHHYPHHRSHHHQYYQSQPQQYSSLTGFPMSRAEPQVPIYRSATRRVTLRRASEGSTGSSTLNNFDSASYASTDALRSCDHDSRFSIDSRRDSSLVAANESTYDSACALLGNEGSRNESVSNPTIGNSGIDDSVIMTRLRKSFEQKEEFLRRPSHPIGLFLPDQKSEPRNESSATAIPREFYARPQKLQRQIWPPNEPKQEQRHPSSSRSAQSRSAPGKAPSDKSQPSDRGQRFAANSTEDIEYLVEPRNNRLDESFNATRSLDRAREQMLSDRLYVPSVYDDHRDTSDWKELPDRQQQQQQMHRSAGKSNNFVGTLSKIQENIASTGVLFSGDRRSDANNGASSLPSSPGPEKKVNDKFSPLPQGLQIVSRRAKQFESGRLMSDDDEPTGDRTNLYKSELSRLSNKRSVPNVAVRKREFESKAEAQEPRRLIPSRETKSLDTETPNLRSLDEDENAQTRIRSSSVESWDSMSGSGNSQTARHRWSQRPDDERRRTKDDGRYDGTNANFADNSSEKSSRKDTYAQIIETDRGALPDNAMQGNGVVFRRQKNAQIADEDRATRRVSYLKATWGERMHVDSDLELSDSEPIHGSRSVHKRWRLPLFPNDIASLRRIFEEVTQSASLSRNAHRNTCSEETNIVKDVGQVGQVEREGPLHVKFTVLDGKRSSDRSWKQVWGVLRGPILFFYKDRQNQSPSLANDGENVAQSVDVRCSLVDIAENYTKRKHVLRLANPNAEVLLQTEDAASMALWLRALHEHAAAEKPSEVAHNSTLKQQAVPQTPCSTSNSSTCQTIANTNSITIPSNGGVGVGAGGQRLSPLPGHKSIKKLTSFRNRSPTGQSPINKTRKPSQTIESLISPKTKTWKGRVAKQLRRMHGQSGPPSSPTTQLPPEGATFRVPLELCPPSSFSEYVPLIVEMCTSIVEARGLEVVGIYRVPGNTAAISHLTDTVNKGFENINLQDPRWSDVNVISSLLKSFFRQLPDSLLTAELYPMFIDADKVEDPQRRMTTIRKLLRDLPEHHFETLKYLMFHLKKIVEHSEINKMEAKNLAIVFGPTLVRASGSRDNMVTMVTDMSHQCRIVESLLNNVDWFFSDDDLDDLSRLSVNLSLPADTSEIDATSSNNHNLLLNNIQKVEGVREMASAKDIVSSIISAANRKIQRRRKVQDETDNENHEVEKTRTKPEAESLPNRQSMALNERQCSVSEMVLMHENNSQSNRSVDRASTMEAAINLADGGDINGGDNGGGNRNDGDEGNDVKIKPESAANGNDVSSDRSRKYLNPSVESIESSIQPARRSAVSSASESPSRLSSETGLSFFDTSSTLSSASNDTKQSNDEVAIRTYAGLSATTQERIRRFEQETKAMLQRDQNRQRREAEKREEERRRIEMQWQLAKREMENDDLLDSIVDTTVTPPYHRLSTVDRPADQSFVDVTSLSSPRIPPLSIAVQQQPSTARRVSRFTEEPATTSSETVANNFVKKMKTDAEPVTEQPTTLSPVRYGSLDSLHETHDARSSLSPTNQRRKPVSSDVSDDGSDLLTSLTTTFDRKWRSLLNSSNQDRSAAESVSFNDEDNSRNPRSVPETVEDTERKTQSIETYRDPSLHRSSVDKYQLARPKNDAPEKDTDSSVAAENNRNVDRSDDDVPDNDRSAVVLRKIESNKETTEPDSTSTSTSNETQECCNNEKEAAASTRTDKSNDARDFRHDVESNYSNKLEKFESLTNFEVRSRLKRSESLNKRSENACSKLKRSESLNKHSVERLCSPSNGKLKRSESLNKHSERSDSPNSKLKRSESLTKTEKTECNISKRRQSVRKDSATKLKRKNGMPERSIKRRHTVGGTKDFDKVHWLDNKLQVETERVVKNEYRPKKSQLRTSSPDLSTARIGLTDASFLIEVSFRGPSNVVFNVTNARPQSLPDTTLPSKVYKVPLESHV
ncbi:rho GTPase activating protein at 19D isoform X2 [Megachile rotundata]|uniref:rho GTPase activating protein at 19D isoform X2 n=1 Tax=Megachile rotundata TaxID=143995 RepID=UPI003FD66885